MIRWAVCVAVVLGVASSANALTVRYRNWVHPSSEALGTLNQAYLEGANGGLEAYNSALVHDGVPPLFCLPPNLALTTEQEADIMTRAAEALAKKSANVDDFPIDLLLLRGLEETFPCDKTK